MTPAERDESNARLRQIARASREANPPRAQRIIPPVDRDEEMLGLMGFTLRKENPEINWAALTRG